MNNELLKAAEAALAYWVPTHADSDHHLCCAKYIPPRPCDCGAAMEFEAHDALRAAVEAAKRAAASPVSEAEIEAWRSLAMLQQIEHPRDAGREVRALDYFVTRDEIDEAMALIRRAQGGAK